MRQFSSSTPWPEAQNFLVEDWMVLPLSIPSLYSIQLEHSDMMGMPARKYKDICLLISGALETGMIQEWKE